MFPISLLPDLFFVWNKCCLENTDPYLEFLLKIFTFILQPFIASEQCQSNHCLLHIKTTLLKAVHLLLKYIIGSLECLYLACGYIPGYALIRHFRRYPHQLTSDGLQRQGKMQAPNSGASECSLEEPTFSHLTSQGVQNPQFGTYLDA